MQNSKSIVVRQEEIQKMLQQPEAPGKRLLEPMRSLAVKHGLPFNILEDVNIVNRPEIHRHEADLWYCLLGQVVFTCGGELINPIPLKRPDGSINERELSGDGIHNGEQVVLKPGDWLWIPAGEAHEHSCTGGAARLVIIKIPSVARS